MTNNYGREVQKTSEHLLKENMYDFVGTDTHHQNHLQLLKTIATKKNVGKIETLLHNNKKFLTQL